MNMRKYIAVSMGGVAAIITSGCATVTFEPTEGGSIIGDDKQYIWFGGDAEEVFARSKDGYYFEKWQDPKSRADHKVNPLTITNVNDSRIVVAKFVPSETARTQVSTSPGGTEAVQIKTTSLEKLRYMTRTTPARMSIQVVGDA